MELHYLTAFIEMNPEDARAMAVAAGDVAEVFNGFGGTYAIAYPQKAIKACQPVTLFGYIRGVPDAAWQEPQP